MHPHLYSFRPELHPYFALSLKKKQSFLIKKTEFSHKKMWVASFFYGNSLVFFMELLSFFYGVVRNIGVVSDENYINAGALHKIWQKSSSVLWFLTQETN